jgi:enoyl-CoA hydratase
MLPTRRSGATRRDEEEPAMFVEVTRRDDVLIAQIDDGKVNALSFEVVGALRDAVSKAAGKGCPLVLVGRDGSFSAGFDLAVMRCQDASSVRRLLESGSALYRDLIEAPIPTIAACTGHAVAGGALLLLAIDYRVARPGPYKIGLNEVRIGMTLPEFAVVLAKHRLDPRHLASATFLAEIATPERAKEIGFLDEIAHDPEAAAVSMAQSIAASLPLDSFAASKRRVFAKLIGELEQCAGDTPRPKTRQRLEHTAPGTDP